MKKITIPLDIYDTYIDVVWGDEEKCKKYIKRIIGYSPDLSPSRGICFSKDNYSLIWLSDPSLDDVIVHESFHAVSHLFRVLGIKLCEHSEEAYSYILDFIFSKIKQKINYESKRVQRVSGE